MPGTFFIPPDALSRAFPNGEQERAVREAIGQLIERYDLRGKKVLSLGAGIAREERWLAELGGNELTVVDIDEHKGIEPFLQSCEEKGTLKYIIGDALLEKDFPVTDILYMSSLLPDEMRRFQIATSPSTFDMFLKRLLRIDRLQWPIWRGPIHPEVMKLARVVSPGGLLINQSYAYSLDAKHHVRYLDALRLQMRRHSFQLLEVYRFTETVGVMLYVAQRSAGAPISFGPPLTKFHGRAEVREPIQRIYP